MMINLGLHEILLDVAKEILIHNIWIRYGLFLEYSLLVVT